MKSIKSMLIIVLLLLFTNNQFSYSQEKKAEDKIYWLDAGFGYAGSKSENDHYGYNINATLLKENVLYTVRHSNVTEVYTNNIPRERVFDIGLLVGKGSQKKLGYFSISAGVSLVGGVNRFKHHNSDVLLSEVNRDYIFTIGLPLEAQLFIKPWKNIGIGLKAFGNINVESSFAGITLNIYHGRFANN